MNLEWKKAAQGAWSAESTDLKLQVEPKGDGRWSWWVSRIGAAPMASGVASSLGAAKDASARFAKRTGLE